MVITITKFFVIMIKSSLRVPKEKEKLGRSPWCKQYTRSCYYKQRNIIKPPDGAALRPDDLDVRGLGGVLARHGNLGRCCQLLGPQIRVAGM